MVTYKATQKGKVVFSRVIPGIGYSVNLEDATQEQLHTMYLLNVKGIQKIEEPAKPTKV